MRLTARVFLIFSVVLAGTIVAANAYYDAVLLSSFEALEHDHVTEDMYRVTNALNGEVQSLRTLTRDWANWSDTRDFVLGKRPSYAEENLGATMFENNNVQIVAFFDPANKLVYGEAFDEQTLDKTRLPSAFEQLFGPGGRIFSFPTVDTVHAGFVELGTTFVMLAAAPILNNEASGPINGTLIFARYLDDDDLQAIVESVRMTFSVAAFHSETLSADILAARQSFSAESPVVTRVMSSTTIIGYAAVNDVFEQPALIIRLEQPRSIYERGQATRQTLTFGAMILGMVSGVAVLFILNRLVLHRLKALSAVVTRIRASDDLNTPVPISGRDEITHLAEGLQLLLVRIALSHTRLETANRDLAAASEALAENMKQRTQILANVSHDSRTPLTAIGLYTESLLRGLYGPISDKQRSALEGVLANSRQLLTFVNNLLTEALLSSNALSIKITPCKPRTVIDQAVTTLKPLIVRKGLELSVRYAELLPETLLEDSERLKQVVLNLLDNAVKFSDKGTICIEVLVPTPSLWSIRVADTGRGIPPERLEHIFEPYFQIDGSITRDVNRGVGMGLHIVKRVVSLMYGSITVESKVGEGTAFTVSLPLETAAGQETRATRERLHAS